MIELQRASAGDRLRIEDFQQTAYARTEAIVGARAIPLEWDYDKVLDECEVWLDESGGSLRGVLILRIREADLFLESIATAPEAAGSGRARLLMEATFERARGLGLDRISLITNSLNPALAWYKRMGFSVELEDVQAQRTVVHMSMPVPDA